MKRFKIERSNSEIISNTGLALVGAAISKHTNLSNDMDNISLRHGTSHSDIIKSYLGLLSTGKSDYEALNGFQDNSFFQTALDLKNIPTVDTLRQRMDKRAEIYLPGVRQAAMDFLISVDAPITALPMGHVPLDADVTPFDNSGTKKEGVSYTYKGHDGYAPMAAYLGQEGYCIEFELREGKQHCQKGTPELLKSALEKSAQITDKPILLRLDGGNDSIENVDVVLEFNKNTSGLGADFIIKWNPRTNKDPEEWLKIAEEKAKWKEPRPGKRVGIFDISIERVWKKHVYTIRRVMRVIERTIDKNGQSLLIPEIEVEGWWTSLVNANSTIISLYADHGTSEQLHSEFKTDLDIERFPSGKFETNHLVLVCSTLVYNILRYIGQTGLIGKGSGLRNKAKRRRIKTVMQELMYLASKFVATGRRIKIKLGRSCPVKDIFEKLYYVLAYG